MNLLKPCLSALAVLVVSTLTGCSTTSTKAPDLSGSLRASLDQAGYKDVSATEDVDKGVVTLTGHVTADSDKVRAETIAKAIAGAQVVANQIAVVPAGVESQANAVNADLDKGIEKNLDAALIVANLHDNVKYDVKNHVVTLSGQVDSPSKRAQSEQVALAVLNVHQVVNEIQVKDQKATSSN